MLKQSIMWALICSAAPVICSQQHDPTDPIDCDTIKKALSGRSNSYIAVRFNLSLDFGRKVQNVDVPDNDFDNDSGIFTRTK